ncbi:MAG: hypothetical protein JST16_18890 [Bdellovibrionales bacterium]|nr:hypothetical protein [Bdellovibrionales bacterium]
MSLRAALVLVLSLSPLTSRSQTPVIEEAKKLLHDLSPRDPMHPVITLRLADMLFNHANEMNRDGGDSSAKESLRRRSLGLYRDYLQERPNSGEATRVNFQIARLLTDLGDLKQAMALWRTLADKAPDAEIRREALLRLAEYDEALGGNSDLQHALANYKTALELCKSEDSCFYTRYRMAWAQFRLKQYEAALENLDNCLLDSKQVVREEVLRNLYVFWSQTPGAEKRAVSRFDNLSDSLGRPDMLHRLAEAFSASGNSAGRVLALEAANKRQPRVDTRVRLLEEYYAARRVPEFRSLLNSIADDEGTTAARGTEQQVNIAEAAFRRLLVQLDAERRTRPDFRLDFEKSAITYINLFPKSEHRTTAMQGWVAAEPDADKKLTQLAVWIQAEPANSATQKGLRELRAAVAQEAQRNDVVADEMKLLAASAAPGDIKAREHRYIRAKSLYDAGKVDESLLEFQSLATYRAPQAPAVDKWAIQSEHLALDILNQKKNYAALLAQARLWTNDSKLANDPKLASDVAEIRKIEDQASFEDAATQSDPAKSLELFKGYCLSGKFLPKSCENARVLAVKRNDTTTLLAVLEKMNSSEELASQYEAAGHYSKAAELREHMLKESENSFVESSLKTALLYELADRPQDQKRVLARLIKGAPKTGFGKNEEWALRTLKDAKMLDSTAFALNWSPAAKGRVANAVEEAGAGTPQTQKVLLASTKDLGSGWSKIVIGELQTESAKQAKITFTGRNSQQNFKARLALMNKLKAHADSYIPGASAGARSEIATVVSTAYASLAQAVLATPTPADIPADQAEQIKASLKEMSEPFAKLSAEYAELAAKSKTEATIAPVVAAVTPPATPPSPGAVPAPAPLSRAAAVERLHLDPFSSDALSALKNYYETQGNERLSSYFKGRLAETPNGGSL